ncbi:MAG TPA: hypothetical protein VGR21_02170 [Cryptosporangiaceae bacterium]|nr:hypothetical protein [Cryptosporangiaceae bacterium]
MCDIRRLGGEIAERLALMSPGVDCFRFDATCALSLPPSMESDSLVLQGLYQGYDESWFVDSVQLHATRETLRALGVIVLSSLFAPPDSATDIALTHPASEIRTLRVTAPSATSTAGLERTVSRYDCWPGAQRHKFPWSADRVDPLDLPAVRLTNHDDMCIYPPDDERLVRDTVAGFGTQNGVARFGQFLIDAGHPGQSGDEYHLESEAGVRGVAPMSAELHVWLPGSFGWETRHGLG